MSSGVGLRIGLAGATGALGKEVLAVLEERRFPLRGLSLFASERSVGQDVEIAGDVIPIQTGAPTLQGLDLVIVCTPPAAALEWVRDCLRAEVPCIDCSGALAGSGEVPLLAADLCSSSAPVGQPAVAGPAGPTLSWAFALAALDRAVGVKRVVGTVLQSAAHAGRRGIEALSGETIAILSQSETRVESPFATQVAFDCIPAAADQLGDAGATVSEAAMARDLARILDRPVPVAVSIVQVPTFVGDGSSLVIEVESGIAEDALGGLFEKASGVELWDAEVGPTTRDTSGRDVALVSRLRLDPSTERGVQLWVAADALRLAAVNAVKLAEARLQIQ